MGRKERSHTGFHYGKWHKTKNRTPMWSSNSTPRVEQAFSCTCHYWTKLGTRGDAEMTDDRQQNCGQVYWMLRWRCTTTSLFLLSIILFSIFEGLTPLQFFKTLILKSSFSIL
jgi:hypothetical protein